ncbi:RNA 2'-phosphotransferase [Shimazuella sp. AN120528]|uniref:RNA 2'-phosphotransferase n=1 Tax=Shimazuella soli TaxID=1892854 RepID=UPI001F103C4B|nr:RNA 2'-phosphotransferase [Shimazuella soli]MCH5585768.1 RNA 2'-phosphotransferase [Shimazuella soli]
MDDRKLKNTSKFLSLILRHQPELIGIKLDQNGWVSVSELLTACKTKGKLITMEELEFIVETNNKKRFSFDDKKLRIRANQGHSIKVDLGYKPKSPPDLLYHGTAKHYLEQIFKTGLHKKSRHHVHLSLSPETAKDVGKRHGVPVILTIYAYQMAQDGYLFYVSENGVWLTEHVPPKYILQKDKR